MFYPCCEHCNVLRGCFAPFAKDFPGMLPNWTFEPYHAHRCPAAGCLGGIVAPEKAVLWVISGIVAQYEPRLLE